MSHKMDGDLINYENYCLSLPNHIDIDIWSSSQHLSAAQPCANAHVRLLYPVPLRLLFNALLFIKFKFRFVHFPTDQKSHIWTHHWALVWPAPFKSLLNAMSVTTLSSSSEKTVKIDGFHSKKGWQMGQVVSQTSAHDEILFWILS